MAVAVDGSGNAYVGGYTSGGVVADSDRGQRDAFVRKLDASGTTSWTRQFGSTENDFVFAARVDVSGNLYVAGSTAGEIGGPSEGIPRSLRAQVRRRRRDVMDSPRRQCVLRLRLCPGHRRQERRLPRGIHEQRRRGRPCARLDASGAAQWTKEIGTPRSDTALAAAADADGNLYVAGYTGVFFTTSDAFVLYVPTE